MADRCVSVSLVSGTAEERAPCRETRAGFEKMATGIPGAVWTTRNSIGRWATGRDVITRSASGLDLASDPAGELSTMHPVPNETCCSYRRAGILPDGSGVVK